MQSQITWVVAANGSQAKLFRVTKFPKIEELIQLEHLESRLKNQDLVSSKQGRTFESTGASRSAYEESVDPHHPEIEKFARFLAQHLAEACRNKSFSRLYLMASPAFLGHLRAHLDHATQAAIVAEVGKDMTEQSLADIETHLEKA